MSNRSNFILTCSRTMTGYPPRLISPFPLDELGLPPSYFGFPVWADPSFPTAFFHFFWYLFPFPHTSSLSFGQFFRVLLPLFDFFNNLFSGFAPKFFFSLLDGVVFLPMYGDFGFLSFFCHSSPHPLTPRV